MLCQVSRPACCARSEVSKPDCCAGSPDHARATDRQVSSSPINKTAETSHVNPKMPNTLSPRCIPSIPKNQQLKNGTWNVPATLQSGRSFVFAFAARGVQNHSDARDGVESRTNLVQQRFQLFFFHRAADDVVPVLPARLPSLFQLVGCHFQLSRAIGQSAVFHNDCFPIRRSFRDFPRSVSSTQPIFDHRTTSSRRSFGNNPTKSGVTSKSHWPPAQPI